MNPMEAAATAKKQQERETLRNVIAQWNANRLDLFELSEPNEDLEFHGVMRFYFQDSGQKVATKCIRVASDATSQAVIETLIEKFRADMRMLSLPEYALYEIHENGDERRLGMDEKPLLVQLNWHMDDREGRFLLRRIDDKTNVPAVGFQEGGSSFRRKLSKREKKQLKKQEKLNKLKTNATTNNENDGGVAGKLYTELPETSFTRSISNPEAVMRRRRQQKLERKLQQFRSKDGGPDTGGTLKIYGESLCRDVPYKTLLLSVRDTAQQVVKEMLTKYGLDREIDPHNYCLVQVNTAVPADNGESKEYHGGTNNREYILDDDECPLAILMNHPSSRGSIMFHVRRRPADYHPRKRKKKPQQKWNKGSELMEYRYEDGYDRLPFFLELNPDGTDIVNGTPKRHRLHPNVTEVGSERPINTAGSQQHGHQSQSLQLFGPNVQPRHCVIAHTEGIVTVTPCSGNAETYVNGQRIYETTILQNGAIVKFGRIHNFRFIDPSHDDRSRQRHDSARQGLDFPYDRQSSREDTVSHGGASAPGHSNSSNNIGSNNTNSTGTNGTSQNYETTFDVDGNVETVSTSSLGNKEETRSQRSVSSSRDGNRVSNYERYPRGTDPILPAVLEFREETEEAFLHAVVTDLDPAAPHFKLAPTYTLYLVARYRASTHYRPELTPTERAHRLTVLLARVAAIIHNVIQERYADAKSLAFWMANSSELLHFLKSDRHISAFSLDAQDILADCVQIAFKNLVSCLQGDLAAAMPHFMSERDDNPEDESTATVLQVLTSAMALLRRCRVNAALTIQLFSQLFHFINMWAFNKVVTSPTSPHPQQPNSICYCTKGWGLRLKSKLAQLEAWAERQGLELAADCHLARIIQASHLLQAPKYNADDLATLSSTCFKLNSLQLRALLSKYQPTPDEPRLPHELIENVVRVAENVADELARSDGREVRLEEERELQLPFLLPEDGYSCDVVRGVPQGLAEFLAPLQHAGLCRLSTQPTSSGLWTIYMMHEPNPGARSPSALSNRSGGYPPPQQEPEIQIIKLNKSNNGMGLSIVAAKGAGQDRLGIYIKSVVKGGAADVDGQLQAGDQLLKVDGQSLVGITQEKAAEYLVRTGPTAALEVAKQGAIYHGLATLLQQPSPVMGRAPYLTRSRPNSQLLTPSYNIRPGRGFLPPSMSVANLHSSASANKLHPSACQERLVDWNNSESGVISNERLYPSNPSIYSALRMNPVSSSHFPGHSQCLQCTSSYVSEESGASGNSLTVPHTHSKHTTLMVIGTSKINDSESGSKFCNAETNTESTSTVNGKASSLLKVPSSEKQEYPALTKFFHKKFMKGHIDESDGVSTSKGNVAFKAQVPEQFKCNSVTCGIAIGAEDGSSSSVVSSGDCNDPTSPCHLNDCCSPSSTLTSDSSDPAANCMTDSRCKYSSNKLELKITNGRNETADQNLCADYSFSLNKSMKKIKDVDDILLGNLNTSDVSKVQGKLENFESTESDGNVEERITSMLNLDLSSIKDEEHSSNGRNDGIKQSKCWKSPEEVRLGCGRVAALAKHFSRLGDNGLIRICGREGYRGSIEPGTYRGVFQSVPDMSRMCLDKDGKQECSISGPVTSCNCVYSVELGTVSYSMHHLLFEDSSEDVGVQAQYKSCEKLDLKDDKTEFKVAGSGGNAFEKEEGIQGFEGALYSRHARSEENMQVFTKMKSKDNHLHSSNSVSNSCIPQTPHECTGAKHRAFILLASSGIPFKHSKSECSFVSAPSYVGSSQKFPLHSAERPKSEDNILQVGILSGVGQSWDQEKNLCTENENNLRPCVKSASAVLPKQIGRHVIQDCRPKSEDNVLLSAYAQDSCCLFSDGNYVRRKSEPQSATANCANKEPEHTKFPAVTRWPRRMSERDLPSRLLIEQNHIGDSRRNIAPHVPIQSSKSVPSLNSGNNDLVHGPTSPGPGPSSAPGTKQHEVFNPGYSRTSSTNSIPQKTFDMQSQPANGAGLRSKSSQNLTDPRSPTSALPPPGLGSRQSSNPSLHHSPHLQSPVHPHHMNQQPLPSQINPQHPALLHTNHHPPQPLHPSQMVPQYPSQNQLQQQLHLPHNQLLMNQHQMNQQNQMQSQQGSDGERFYQNLSIYRNHELQNGYPPPSPNRGKLPSPQAHEDRSPTHQQKSLRGSQSSLHRPSDGLQSGTRDRPASAYIPQKDQYGSPQHGAGMAPRSQSTRDIMRQEAKLQEMQEEVRRREMRGGVTSPQHYPLQPGGQNRPQMLPGHPQRVPNTNYPYNNQDPNNPLHSQHNAMLPYSPSLGHIHPQSSNGHPLSPSYSGARPHQGYVPPPTAPKPTRYPGPVQASNELQRQHFPADSHHQNVLGQEIQGQVRPPLGSDAHGSVRPSMPPEDVGYRDSPPPPPPPPTSTHPLYQPGSSSVGQKLSAPSGNPDNRYTASMGEPPRGTYYPASPGTGSQPPRHFQFSATNPWEREEREKEQQRRREAARAWRDQQISELSSLPQRTVQQEEQLRALKLEREFQRRAEECARQEEEEEGEEDQESVERVQGLLRMATQQHDDTDHSQAQQQNSRRPHVIDFQQNGRSSLLPPPNTMPKSPLPSGGNTTDEKEKTRKAEEVQRKPSDLDAGREEEDRMLQDTSKRRDEEARQNLQQHQILHPQNQTLSQSSQSNTPHTSRPLTHIPQTAASNNNQYMLPTPKPANPSHLRLDNLVINGPASPPQIHHSRYQSTTLHQQYNGYVTPQSSSNSTTTTSSYYQPPNAVLPVLHNTPQKVESVNYYQHQDSNANSKPPLTNPASPLQQSGAQRLDSLLMSSSQQTNSLNERNTNLSFPPQPPERGSSFAVMSQTQGVLRNSTTNMSSAGSEKSNMVHGRGSDTNPTTSTTIKRVSFHDPNANQPPPQPTTQPPLEQIREDPNHFINEAETLLASPKSPDGGPFAGNTPGVIGAQEVYKDPRARLLAAQHQKLLSTRSGHLPEKLSFKEKMKMFAMETGEDGTPRDKVKISRAQREIDNLGTPTGSSNNGN